MYTDIILYTILILVILYDVLAYLYDLFYSENSKYTMQKHLSNIETTYPFTYDLFKRNAITKIESSSIIIIPETYKDRPINELDIKELVKCDKFIISKNINFINNLNLDADEVISNSLTYKVVDNLILDKYNNVICIFKNRKLDNLKEIAKTYSISKRALHYFSNAKYLQFAKYKGLYEFRISKPYFDTNEEVFAVVPEKIDNNIVEAISVNYAIVNLINIPSYCKRFVIEKKSCYKNLVIDPKNQYFVIVNHSLLNKNEEIFVNDNINTFNLINTINQKSFLHPYRKIHKKYLNFHNNVLEYRIEQTNNE